MPIRNTKQTLAWGLAAGLSIALAAGAVAGIDPNSGIDFVRIAHPGNAPWMGDGTVGDHFIGRGRVDYEFSIGRYEWTTAQAVEFFNAAYDRPANDRIPHLIPPSFWGAVSTTPSTPGGLRWRVPAGNELRPVGDISWRMAAIACNWYHNGKATNREAFLNGAYDVSTFSYNPDQSFNDQLQHNPGARYWIPTWDELLKSGHFDPNRYGPGQPGWWVYSNGTDQPLVGGPPTQPDAQANFGFNGGFDIPLGAYAARAMSPWGLLDIAGATSEWTEEPVSLSLMPGDTRMADRVLVGSFWNSAPGWAVADSIYVKGSEFPRLATYGEGFRIASAVPAPGVGWAALGCVAALTCLENRKRGRHVTPAASRSGRVRDRRPAVRR